jgi:hypothetical protein
LGFARRFFYDQRHASQTAVSDFTKRFTDATERSSGGCSTDSSSTTQCRSNNFCFRT